MKSDFPSSTFAYTLHIHIYILLPKLKDGVLNEINEILFPESKQPVAVNLCKPDELVKRRLWSAIPSIVLKFI